MGNSTVVKSRGVIAAGHALTADAADQILRAGGNAFDAVLAGLCAACAAEPVLASPGGGGFLLALPARERPRLYDFFVHTPGRRRPEHDLEFGPIIADFGTAQQEFHIGRGTIAVPGMVGGLFTAHADLARMPMRDIVAPAVALATEGVRVTPYQAYLFSVVQATFLATDACHRIFASPSKPEVLVREGDVLRNPALADTLETLAIEGEALFYHGEMAQALVADLQAGGQITLDDMRAYRVERREPLTLTYRGVRVQTNPPPASGGLLTGFGLKLLEATDVRGLGFGSPEHVALLAAVMGATSEARVDARAGGACLVADAMLAPEFLAAYREQVAGRRRCARGTTHISVIDADGNLASLTITNGEGSGYVLPGTGIVLNNMLGEEDLNPGGFQRWPCAHRMTSMMAPTAVEWRDGKRVATGSGGSNRIRGAILQVLSNLIDFEMPVEDAVCAPRMHFEDGLFSVEGGHDRERLDAVLGQYPRHHFWDDVNMFFGGAHTAVAEGRRFSGAGDPRRGGACVVA